jgi:hypothetical protein
MGEDVRYARCRDNTFHVLFNCTETQGLEGNFSGKDVAKL